MEKVVPSMKEIPMFVNTLENSYCNICICGRGEMAENLYEYFKDNKSIVVWQLETVEEDYRFPKSAELVIFMNKMYFEPINVDGEKVYFIEYVHMLYTNECLPFNDIYQNIIPKMKKEGIKVLIVKTPNLRMYKPKIPLYTSMAYFKFIQKYHRNRDAVLLKHYGERKLLEEFINTKADKSKGYLRVLGNGEYINYDDGFRRIPNRKEIDGDKPHIYLFGFCISANPMLPDEKTIGANIQNFIGDRYRVSSRGNDGSSINLIMRSMRYQKGDIVVLFTSYHDTTPDKMNLDIIELTDAYKDISKLWRHISDDSFHCDAYVAEVISQLIINKIKEYSIRGYGNEKRTVFGANKRKAPSIEMYKDAQLIQYVNRISKLYRGG